MSSALITAARVEKAVRSMAESPVHEIAAHLGVSLTTVYSYWPEGVEKPRVAAKDTELHEIAIAMRSDGYAFAKISEIVGIPVSRLHAIVVKERHIEPSQGFLDDVARVKRDGLTSPRKIAQVLRKSPMMVTLAMERLSHV